MKPEINANISVIEPVADALEMVKTILFRPFDLEKWLIIGLCAWLAFLGSGGGFNGGGPHFEKPEHTNVPEILAQAKVFVMANLIWLIPLVSIIAIAGILIWLVLTWLSSRGHFMFVHCIAHNKAEARVPWNRFSSHGNSLFLFRVILGLITFITLVTYVILAGVWVVGSLGEFAFTAGFVFNTIFAVLGLLLIWLVLFLVKKLTLDFVVPIMFLRTSSCTAAWGKFLEILFARKGSFILYLLFQLVISIVIGAMLLAMICITCCCAGCIMLIPYVGTVLLLPVLVFKRAYSLCYLRQFGPDFDVFTPVPELV
jgi:hypothetical protein